MKKAFDANVSRAKPRVRLGAMMSSVGGEQLGGDVSALDAAVEAIAEQVARSENNPDLTSVIRNRQFARTTRVSASEAIAQALDAPSERPTPAASAAHVAELTATMNPPREEALQRQAAMPPPVFETAVYAVRAPVAPAAPVPAMKTRNHAEAPATVTEVQAPAAPSETVHETGERRERLRERLRAVRENPRPEPLPETVAEAGVLAVERISALQTELSKARAMNLALAQDLEAARRQAERATEEARLRMDEARRLSSEMEGRVKLLSDLERELESLESERNEALLALQESRQAIEAGSKEKLELQGELLKRDTELNESLVEEERLAGELEVAQENMTGLRRAADALKNERDTLAKQVSDLTRERAELLEARKALEAVHRALSQAALKQ